MLFALDEGLRIQVQKLAQLAQEFGGAVQTNRCLQIRSVECLTQHAAELAVHADVDVGFDQPGHIGQMRAQRKDHVDLGADALHQAADLGQVTGRIKRAVARADDVDARLFAGRTRFARGHLAQTVFRP